MLIVSAPSISAMVRATRKTRCQARADRRICSATPLAHFCTAGLSEHALASQALGSA